MLFPLLFVFTPLPTHIHGDLEIYSYQNILPPQSSFTSSFSYPQDDSNHPLHLTSSPRSTKEAELDQVDVYITTYPIMIIKKKKEARKKEKKKVLGSLMIPEIFHL